MQSLLQNGENITLKQWDVEIQFLQSEPKQGEKHNGNLIGIYFSGTGNTKFCVDKFLAEYDNSKNTFSIEDKCTLDKIKNNHEIVIGYPVQYSNIPKILRDYVMSNQYIWKGKKVFIIATMGLFSGDGAGILARLLNSYGAVISGGLHLKMPDSIGDVKVLKRKNW